VKASWKQIYIELECYSKLDLYWNCYLFTFVFLRTLSLSKCRL